MGKTGSFAGLFLAIWIGVNFWPAQAAEPDAGNLLPHDQARLLVKQSEAYEKLGEQDDALVAYTRAIESHVLDREEQARALFDRGLLLDGMNRLNDALGDYSAALTLAPKFAAALNNRGNVYRRIGHLTEARRDYLAALAAGNGQGQFPYYGLGQIAEAKGNVTQAKTFYMKALAADPGYMPASERLASIENDNGIIHLRPPTARKTATSNNPTPPDDAPIVLHLPGFAPAPQEPIHLHPRQSKALAIAAAAYGQDGGAPGLKPSLDASHGAEVQLGAWRSEAEATHGWNRALQQAGDVLQGLSHLIVAADLPGAGRYYRLRVSTDKTGAKALCAALAAKGLACFPVRD